MIVIIPTSKLKSIIPPDVLACRERWLVCLTHDDGSIAVMGLAHYCETMRRRRIVRHGKAQRVQHVPSCTVHPTPTAQ
jgi:hypothetical protein